MGFKEEFRLESNQLNEKRVFRDAVHNYIHVDHLLIWQLINSEEMQRLRRIKQLGGTYQVFPSAEHSRFAHSLGVYEVVKNMIENDYIKDYINDYDKLCVMCAGLLHDIGHGPFSHSFESIFDCHHEDMTVRIILEDTEVNRILSNFYEELPEDVASIINRAHPNRLLVQMISSQLDADRMDYLLRDSYMSGTTYGNFDMSRIFRTMRVIDNKLVFKESGVLAIENYILARYYMYWQVYFHPTSRSYEHLLECIFIRLKDLYNNRYSFKCDIRYLLPILNNEMTISDYIHLDDSIIEFYFREFINEEDEILSDLAYRFLNRHLFKYKEYSDKEYERIKQISNDHGYDSKYYVFKDSQKEIPYHHYLSGDISEIEIKTHQGLKSLVEVSEIVNAIVKENKYKEDHKIFFVKEIKDAL